MVEGGRKIRGSSKLRRAAFKIFHTCGSFSRSRRRQQQQQSHLHPLAPPPPPRLSRSPPTSPRKYNNSADTIPEETDGATTNSTSTSTSVKNLCAICLDPLIYSSTGSSPGQAIFTAQCCHSFHFSCISSNVRHGGVTCPICRAHWTQLPRNLIQPSNQNDPILQILDHSIATFRLHRRSFLRSAPYNIEPHQHTPNNHHPRLRLTLSSLPVITHPSEIPSQPLLPLNTSLASPSPSPEANIPFPCVFTHYLCVKVAHQPATDLVLVATLNGPHLRLMKQSMALVVFSMRPIDRLAIVAHSSYATRVFPLRRMTSYGKRTALQLIDRLLFNTGQADPIQGLNKGVKILEDRTHENIESCILHLSDSPTTSYHDGLDTEIPVPVHRFRVGVYNVEFEELLARVVGGAIRDIQFRIREEDGRIVRLGELRGGEERRIPLSFIKPAGDPGHVRVEYSYIDECIQTGEVLVGLEEDKRSVRSEGDIEGDGVNIDGRSSNAGSWNYHDPYMARRWAKHLHGGYRL